MARKELPDIETLRASGEVVEITELAREAGFAVPVFISNELYEEISPESELLFFGYDTRKAISDLLKTVARHTDGRDDPILRMTHYLPVWNAAKGEIEVSEMEAAAGLFSFSPDGMFIIISRWEDVRHAL